ARANAAIGARTGRTPRPKRREQVRQATRPSQTGQLDPSFDSIALTGLLPVVEGIDVATGQAGEQFVHRTGDQAGYFVRVHLAALRADHALQLIDEVAKD